MEDPPWRPPGFRDPNDPLPAYPRQHNGETVMPTSFYPEKKHPNYFLVFFYSFCILILILVIFFILAGGIFYLSFDPKLPNFHLQSFQIPIFKVSRKPDGEYLDSQVVAHVEVKNQNSNLLCFFHQIHLNISVGEGDVTLGSQDMPDFSVGKNSVKRLKMMASVKNQLLPKDQEIKLLENFESKDLLLNINVTANAGFEFMSVNVGTVGVNVLCGNVKFKQVQNGSTTQCTVDILKWINVH